MDTPTILLGKRYAPIALLGAGGMGSVYLARDTELEELVAVKTLRPDLVGDPAMLERFRDEVRLARRVSSPFVARTHDLVEHEGRWFLTMQYIDGETLAARLRREGALGVDVVGRVARDICHGLSAIHAAGVVHRDLKPGNILLATGGHAVITDFGIAVRSEAAHAEGDGSGTPAYTAPEQLAGHPVDARADIFSLGATLYAMVTGEKPFPADERTVATPDPRTIVPSLMPAFAAVVTRAMAMAPHDRFESAEALCQALDLVGLGGSIPRKPSALAAFVRTLAAGGTRRLQVEVEATDVPPELGQIARADLCARLNARDHVRVVDEDEEPEAVLHAGLRSADGKLALSLAMQSGEDVFWRDRQEAPRACLPRMIEHAAHGIERAFAPKVAPFREAESFPSQEVADLVVEGRTEYRAFWATHVRRSVELFERALALAPDHPLVLAWCAAAYSRLMFFDDPSEDQRGRDRLLAETAVRVAPDLPEAHVALASSFLHDMRVAEAVPHLLAALRLAPGLAEQRSQLARILQECGAVEPALELARSTYEMDPSFTEPLEVMIRHHALRGRFDESARLFDTSEHPRNDFIAVVFARCAMWARRHDQFMAVYDELEAAGMDRQPTLVMRVMKGVLSGDGSGLSLLGEVRGGSVRRQAFFQQLRAEVLAVAGEHAQALDAIERAVREGLFDIQWLDLCPLFDPLRGMVRFELYRKSVHDRAVEALREIERSLAS